MKQELLANRWCAGSDKGPTAMSGKGDLDGLRRARASVLQRPSQALKRPSRYSIVAEIHKRFGSIQLGNRRKGEDAWMARSTSSSSSREPDDRTNLKSSTRPFSRIMNSMTTVPCSPY